MLQIDNQPVVFNLDKSCLYPVTYKQLVNQGDVTSFQFRLETCFGSPQLVENPSFDNTITPWIVVGTGFTQGNGQAIKSGTSTSLIRQSKLVIGRYYVAEVDVDTIFEEDDNNMVSVNFGVSTVVTGLSEGINRLYGFCEGNTNFEIRSNNNSQIAINSANVFEVRIDYRIIITDESGVAITHFDMLSDVAPFFNSQFITIDQDFVTVDVDWNFLSIGQGCYKIGVADPCDNTNGQNGIFNNNFRHKQLNWIEEVITGTVTRVYDNLFTFTSVGSASGNIRYSGFELAALTEYTVTYTLLTMTNAFLQIELGGVLGTLRTTAATFTENITTSASIGSLHMQIATSATGVIALSEINIQLTNEIDYISNQLSEPFKLEDEHSCTKLIRMSNDVDAFGFNFSIFSPQARIYCDIRAGEDRSEREWVRNSNGVKKIYFADVIFSKRLRISPQPDYIHNFLRFSSKANYFYIDGESFFIEDDEYPDIAWNKQETEGTVALEVSENTLQLNQNCDGANTGGNSGNSGAGSGGGASSGASGDGIAIGLDKDTALKIN